LSRAILLAPALLLPAVAAPLRGQSDSGRVILETRLGGDSAQATRVDLRAGATYRFEFRPAGAQLVIRRRTRDGSSVPPLQLAPPSMQDTLPGWTINRVTAVEAGEHIVELTNPQVGTTTVRLVMLHRAAGDSLPTRLQATLLYNEDVSGGPVYVALDSGQIYRISVTMGTIYLSPRSAYQAPVRFVATGGTTAGNTFGTPFLAEYTGQYRVETDPGATATFRIYSAAGDPIAAACVRNPDGRECLGNPRTERSKLGPFIIALAVPAIFLIDKVFR
jgi:hypothetical protein